jgi:hypothetical protein
LLVKMNDGVVVDDVNDNDDDDDNDDEIRCIGG